jgi:hypothetical protein
MPFCCIRIGSNPPMQYKTKKKAELGIWIRIRNRFRRIRMFLGLPDLLPDLLVTSTDPAPDTSIIKQK